MEELRPQESAPQETPTAEKEPYVPSSRGRRVFAWILFGIMVVGTVLWLLGIADPNWTEKIIEYFGN